MTRAPEVITLVDGQWDDLVRRAAVPAGRKGAASTAAQTGTPSGAGTGPVTGRPDGSAGGVVAGCGRGRRLLGIAGAPGVGKSTVAAYLVRALAPAAVLVPMDGFHLAEAELHRLGRHERKGAIDTFDANGFVALLRRLREERSSVVYAPEFRREIEEPIASAIPVPPTASLIITEGNYLLADEGAWARVRTLLDEVWFLEVDERVRLDRLTARHMAYGRPAAVARARARGSDQRNAELIATTRDRADLVIRLG